MSKKDEALKLALEALEYIYEGANNQGPHTGISWRCVSKKAAPVITALRQALANEALDKKAENARELGLDYEPSAGTQVSKVWWDGEKLMAKQVPLEDFYKPAQQEPVAVHQYRSPHCSDWYDGVPDHHDGHGPYEVRTLYTSPPAQQERVAWKHDCAALLTNDVELWIDHCPHCGKPRTSPQEQRKPLTDEEWQSIADTLGCFITRGQKDAIEAALGIKENT